jgi:hypothetical protein
VYYLAAQLGHPDSASTRTIGTALSTFALYGLSSETDLLGFLQLGDFDILSLEAQKNNEANELQQSYFKVMRILSDDQERLFSDPFCQSWTMTKACFQKPLPLGDQAFLVSTQTSVWDQENTKNYTDADAFVLLGLNLNYLIKPIYWFNGDFFKLPLDQQKVKDEIFRDGIYPYVSSMILPELDGGSAQRFVCRTVLPQLLKRTTPNKSFEALLSGRRPLGDQAFLIKAERYCRNLK